MRIDVRDVLTLSAIPGIGATRMIKLVAHFKDTRLIAEASAKELVRVEGIEKKTALTIVNFFRDSGLEHTKRFVDDQLKRANKADARIVTFWDKEYPSNLRNTYDPPAFLFVRGALQDTDRYAVAIVGTRNASPYGAQMAERFAQGFAALGITVVSGLARGIDTVAHSATLRGHGRTIAVVGSGVDVVYPSENHSLAQRIVEDGAIVSEFPMGAKPDAPNFPRRNRIISGMSLGTLIIETGIEGGAMITASLAFDQNREVFAVPSPANEKRQSGTNLLIKQGKASLVERVDDVVAILAPQLKNIVKPAEPSTRPTIQLSMFEQALVDALGDEAMHIDVLAERARMSTADALVHLLSLEFKGLVRQHPGKMFVKTS
ncbi:MAG: DNA-protecting protein DprA [Ignavibacteria bacterium]